MSDIPCVQRAIPTLIIWVLAIFAAVRPLSAAPIDDQLTTQEKQQLQQEARLVVDLLQNHHYSGRAFREITNTEMVSRFLQELDPNGEFLTKEDVEFIHRRFDRTFKSVYLFRGDLQPAFEIFDLFANRARGRLDWISQRLSRELDLAPEDTLDFSHELQLPTSGAVADRWSELRLKEAVIEEILAGSPPDEARAKVTRRYVEFGRHLATLDSFAVRERFFDALIRSFDPHSGYFSADSSEEFAIDMENAVVGLGLELRKQEGRCIVTAVQPGGPADLHSALAPGDILVAIAEGDGPGLDATHCRLREIVALIRGAPGGKVRLAYLPDGGSERQEVVLERTRVVLTADRAHGAISEVPDPAGKIRKVGWIVLPTFYTGGEGKESVSAAADVHALLDQMLAEHIEGVVLDLRNNPGGALTEAVALSQLFLPGGIALLSRGPIGNVTTHTLKDKPPVYPGPLVVLTSPASASASEIFAGAMKYHQRALIVGGATTFGKGTSQAYIPLAKLPGIDARAAKNWGTLRLTSERFFLPDGRAVQRAGVPSHVVLPEFEIPGLKNEAQLPHALSEESAVPPKNLSLAATPAAAAVPVTQLQTQAGHDFARLPEWELWRTEQRQAKAQLDRRVWSLAASTRQKEADAAEAEFKKTTTLRRQLAATGAFSTRLLEITPVESADAAHQARLRQLAEKSGQLPGQLRNGQFYVESDQGHIRAIPLGTIPPGNFVGDATTLAEAFAKATGRKVTAAETRRMLQELLAPDFSSDKVRLAAIGSVGPEALPPEAARRGAEALLRRITELDPELRRERPGLDIPLRESQRLAAAWAAQASLSSAIESDKHPDKS